MTAATALTVDAYVAAVPAPLAGAVAVLREMLCAELASEGTVRRGHPVWKVGGAPVAGLRVHPAGVTFVITRGAEVDDPSGRLVVSGASASVTVATAREIDGALFAEWLRQADDLEYRADGADSAVLLAG